MTELQEYFKQAAEENISREVYPSFWQLVAKAESSREAELAEALTLHDTPCMSYFLA